MRRLGIQTFVPQPTGSGAVLSRRDPRIRIVLLLLLAFAFAAVSQVALLPVLVLIAAGVYGLSGLSWATLLRRLRVAVLLIGLLVISLPFVSGATVLMQVGPVALYREGVEAAALIGVRFLAIFTVANALLGCGALFDHLRALRALGVPVLMTDLAMLVVRYIEVAHHDLRQMHLAMQVRGGKGHRGGAVLSLPSRVREHAWLIAALLLRSHERSERVYSAMQARGYGARGLSVRMPPLNVSDLVFLMNGGALAALVFILEWHTT